MPDAEKLGISGGGDDPVTVSLATPTRTCSAVSVPSLDWVSVKGSVSPGETVVSNAGVTTVCTRGAMPFTWVVVLADRVP